MDHAYCASVVSSGICRLCLQPNFQQLQTRAKLALQCAVLAALLCGASRFAFAQTAHFSGLQTTVGSGFEEPFAVAMYKSGNLYVGESDGYYVAEIMAVNGAIPASPTIRMLVGGRPTIELPWGLAVDGNGNVFVADSYKGVVDEILAVDGSIPVSPTIRTLGSGLSNPWGVAVDGSGNSMFPSTTRATSRKLWPSMEASPRRLPSSPSVVVSRIPKAWQSMIAVISMLPIQATRAVTR